MMTLISPNGNESGTIEAGNGDDEIHGRGGDDLIRGNGGDDLLRGGTGNDILKGSIGNDELIGGEGNDVLSGGSGEDRLFGGMGNDKLTGGLGDDFLLGGPGNNVLFGGSGADRFVFGDEATGDSKVRDFELGTDAVLLQDDIFAVGFSMNGINAVVELNTGGSISFKGLTIEQAAGLFETAPEVEDVPVEDSFGFDVA